MYNNHCTLLDSFSHASTRVGCCRQGSVVYAPSFFCCFRFALSWTSISKRACVRHVMTLHAGCNMPAVSKLAVTALCCSLVVWLVSLLQHGLPSAMHPRTRGRHGPLYLPWCHVQQSAKGRFLVGELVSTSQGCHCMDYRGNPRMSTPCHDLDVHWWI